MGIIFLVVLIVAIVVCGALGQEYVKTSKEHNRLFRKDMNEIKSRMDQFETDMAKLKEMVADAIIEHA